MFPRLVALRGDVAQRLAQRLGEDHEELAALWARLRPLLAGIAVGERANLSPQDVAHTREAYARHIGLEETELIPLAEAAFDAATCAAIGAEMAARRNVDAGDLPGPASR